MVRISERVHRVKLGVFGCILRYTNLKFYCKCREGYSLLTSSDRSSKRLEDILRKSKDERYHYDSRFSKGYILSNRPSKNKYFIIRLSFPENGLIAAVRHYMFSYPWFIRNGWIPAVDFEYAADMTEGKLGANNFWEDIFVQKESVKEILKKNYVVVGPLDSYYLDYDFMEIVNGADCTDIDTILVKFGRHAKGYYKKLNQAAKKCLVIRPELKNVYENECRALFAGKKRILGVMFREDFSEEFRRFQNMPVHNEILGFHPVCPPLDEVIDKIRVLYAKWDCDGLFVSTKYEFTINKLKEFFSDELMYLPRTRETCYRDRTVLDVPYQERRIKSEESRDEYLTRYFKDIYFLSKCEFLVGYSCGGTQMALVLNNGKYKDGYVFENNNVMASSYTNE